MNYPKIAIIGYGKMGKEIEKVALEKGIIVSDIFDIDRPIDPNKKYEFETAIEFTSPDAVMANIRLLSQMKKNIVVGTTGWYNDFDEAKQLAAVNKTAIVWGSNFSVGMNIFFKLTEFAAKIIDKLEEYDVFVQEIHHNQKKDSPSGTALSLSNILIDNINRKENINTSSNNIKANEISVSSSRGGNVPGTHTINFDSAADTIQLIHTARNRNGFALGAIEAANLLQGKYGFYEFSELLAEIWGQL